MHVATMTAAWWQLAISLIYYTWGPAYLWQTRYRTGTVHRLFGREEAEGATEQCSIWVDLLYIPLLAYEHWPLYCCSLLNWQFSAPEAAMVPYYGVRARFLWRFHCAASHPNACTWYLGMSLWRSTAQFRIWGQNIMGYVISYNSLLLIANILMLLCNYITFLLFTMAKRARLWQILQPAYFTN